jgi:Integrase zinc binding domain
MVIHFRPGKLGTKPNSLTRRWDVYPKEGDSDYASVNLHNFRPVFTNEQLALSLRATRLQVPILHTSIIMDSERLNSDIISALRSDPISAKHINEPSPGWSLDSDGFLQHKTRIYILDVNNLRLHVLQQCHDHPLLGHQGQNKTLDLIRRTYSWLLLHTMVQDYCKSCTACMRARPQRHKPYGLLK